MAGSTSAWRRLGAGAGHPLSLRPPRLDAPLSLGRLRRPPIPRDGGTLVAPLRATTRAAPAPCASGRATARRIRSGGRPARCAPRTERKRAAPPAAANLALDASRFAL